MSETARSLALTGLLILALAALAMLGLLIYAAEQGGLFTELQRRYGAIYFLACASFFVIAIWSVYKFFTLGHGERGGSPEATLPTHTVARKREIDSTMNSVLIVALTTLGLALVGFAIFIWWLMSALANQSMFPSDLELLLPVALAIAALVFIGTRIRNAMRSRSKRISDGDNDGPS